MIFEIFSWRAVLDIALIGAALYFLYRTLIRLGTWKIVAGILIAVVFFIVASYLDLKGIEWIYLNVSHVAVISIVVLFQPELRKMFEKAASMHRNKTLRYDEDFSRIIAESMWKMASQKTGAIIVIPGSEPVDEWLNGGFPVNAIPSMPFILSIFDPNSPGHDGALVVKQGLFSSFGVRLPVSQSGRLGEEYGTRHQAAMGLSERCDAMVIVVSEERGRVSIFYKSKINIMENEKQIINMICSHCGKEGLLQLEIPERKIGKKRAMEIVGSLAVAIVFWIALIASQSEMLEKIISVPVEYTATAEDVVMIGDKPKEIKIHLAGAKSDLNAVIASDLSVKIDLAKSGEGKQTFIISKENIRIPKGIRLIDVDPSSVEITMAKLIKKEIGIEPQMVGKFPEGVVLVSVRTKPEKITAFLPSEETGTLPKNLTTTPIYLDNIHQDTTLFCKIIAPPSIQPVEKRWPDVTVFVSVQAQEGHIKP